MLYMLSIKPLKLPNKFFCPYCRSVVPIAGIIWQGIHICVAYNCKHCRTTFYSPLPIGHTSVFFMMIEPSKNKIFADRNDAYYWLAKPLLRSLQKPSHKSVRFTKIYSKGISKNKKVIIANCIDYLYGHCLLKLFSLERFKTEKNKKHLYLVVFVPSCITWLVPAYVDEVWAVGMDIKKAQQYYIKLEEKIRAVISAFKNVYINPAQPHPSGVHIQDFSKVAPGQTTRHPSVAFYWRADRAWVHKKNAWFPLFLQYVRILQLFYILKQNIPNVQFSIEGVGKQYRFPSWIRDNRISEFNQVKEKKMCLRYSRLTLIIGVLGSHMILPAAHAASVIELVPRRMWSNLGQNIINPSHQSFYDVRLRLFLHRFLPIDIRISTLAQLIKSQVLDRQYAKKYFPTK